MYGFNNQYMRERRKELNITQNDIAAQTGKTQQAVAKWEKGIAEPSINELMIIALALKCSIFKLITEKGDE